MKLVKYKIRKVKSSDEESLPVKSKPVKLFKPSKRQKFFKAHAFVRPLGKSFFLKKLPHEKLMELEDLFDDEIYHYYTRSGAGKIGKSIPGYRLKHSWERLERAWTEPTPLQMLYRQPMDVNWVEVRLPNGKVIGVQPFSHTPTYYRNRGRL